MFKFGASVAALLAKLRLLAPEGDLIDGVELAAETEPLCQKLLSDLDRWQGDCLELPLSRLVRLIYDQTGLEAARKSVLASILLWKRLCQRSTKSSTLSKPSLRTTTAICKIKQISD